jgi:hypothetical protein
MDIHTEKKLGSWAGVPKSSTAKVTHISKEGKVTESAMRGQPILVLGYTVSNLQAGVDLRCAAFEGLNGVEIGNRDKVLNSVKELHKVIVAFWAQGNVSGQEIRVRE